MTEKRTREHILIEYLTEYFKRRDTMRPVDYRNLCDIATRDYNKQYTKVNK